jgi:diguanylate cyclase (GGDEF)-like protein/PAS domain S-box-containing protein
VLGAVVVTGSFAAVLALAPIPRRALVAFDDVAMGLAAAAAGAGCWWAGRVARGRLRVAWWLFGAACAAFTAGQAVWTTLQLADPGLMPPFPSAADVGYVGQYVLMAAAMTLFGELPGGTAARLRMAVDGLIVGTAALVLAWMTVLEPMYGSRPGPAPARALGLAYPVGSVVVLVLGLGLLTRSRLGRGSVVALLTGAVCFLAANSGYALLTATGAYATGHPIDTGWVAGFASVGLAGWLAATGGDRVMAERTREGLLLSVPHVLVVATAVLGAAKVGAGWRPGPPVLAGGTVLGLLLVARQLATQVENLRLRRDLEARVAARTAALAESEARLARAIRAGGLSVWYAEPGGTRLVWAANSESILGVPAAGADMIELVDPRDRPQVEAAVARALGSGGEFRVDHRVRHPDGGERWVATVGEVVPDPGGPPRIIGVSVDITARKRAEAELAHRALHDPLTGLPNRALFLDRVGVALGRLSRTGGAVVVAFCDLDHFKVHNDSLGHAAGDLLLRAAAQRLVDVFGPQDTVARVGGDEFAVACELDGSGGAVRAAEQVAERIAAALAAPVNAGGRAFQLGATTGVVVARDPGADAAGLLRDAGVAMVRAKERDRGGFEIFEPAMRARAVRRLEEELALRRAVERGELVLHYQPAVAVATGEVLGVEALLRWANPGVGLIGPAEVVPLAEETGLILPIGRWVLEEACRTVAAWRGADGRPLDVAVNVSARQLVRAELVGQVAAALESSGLSPERLCLEITESTLMHDAEGVLGGLRTLRAMGVRIAIDDFGTGYSSLAYLRRFPVSAVKIDRGFVAELGREVEDEAIVRAVLMLARSLEIEAIAEGVEVEAQRGRLEALGCRVAQGYLWCPPLPADDLLAWLASRGPSARNGTAGDGQNSALASWQATRTASRADAASP